MLSWKYLFFSFFGSEQGYWSTFLSKTKVQLCILSISCIYPDGVDVVVPQWKHNMHHSNILCFSNVIERVHICFYSWSMSLKCSWLSTSFHAHCFFIRLVPDIPSVAGLGLLLRRFLHVCVLSIFLRFNTKRLSQVDKHCTYGRNVWPRLTPDMSLLSGILQKYNIITGCHFHFLFLDDTVNAFSETGLKGSKIHFMAVCETLIFISFPFSLQFDEGHL